MKAIIKIIRRPWLSLRSDGTMWGWPQASNRSAKTTWKKIIPCLALLPAATVLASSAMPIEGIGASLETYQVQTKKPLPSAADRQMIGVYLNYDHNLGGDRFMRWHAFRTIDMSNTENADQKGMKINLSKDQQHEFSAGFDYQVSLALSDSTSLNPRTGFEYRRFFHGQDTSGNHAYPNQKAHFALVPVGFDVMTRLSANWMLEASGTYQYLVYSNQVAYTSDNSLIIPTAKDIKANGFGTRFGTDLFYLLGHSRLGIGAFLQSWQVTADSAKIKDLPPSYLAFMPNNQARQIGIHVSMHF